MAVFGLPIRREDDALRAVRAARRHAGRAAGAECEHSRPITGITLPANHIGVDAGEVVAGDAEHGAAAGDRGTP